MRKAQTTALYETGAASVAASGRRITGLMRERPMATELSNKELFAAYARTAAREDLAAYLRFAYSEIAQYELPEATLRIVAEMQALHTRIADIDGTPALKKQVWTLISRFKGSIPGFAGACGAPGSWQTTWSYTRAREADVRTVRLKADTTTGEKSRDVRIYQSNPWQLRAAWVAANERADAMHRYRVPMRQAPLTTEDAYAVISACLTADDHASVAAKAPKVASTNWKARALAAEAELAALRAPKPLKLVARSAAALKAWETRRRLAAEALAS